MKDYISYSDSYSATDKNGNTVLFTILTKNGEDSEKAAKVMARSNGWKKVRTYSYALAMGLLGW